MSDGLSIYLKEIHKYPLLTAAKEKELANKIIAGCIESREVLIKSNLRLVVNIAKNYVNRKYHLSDVIEDGNMGLIRAVESFDTSYNTRFSTYATYWIRQSIIRNRHYHHRLVRLPLYMAELIGKWDKAKDKLWNDNGLEPNDEQIANEIGIKKKKIELIKSARVGVESSVTDTETGNDYINSVPAQTQEQRFDCEELATIMGFVDRLPPKEHDIICMRYGLNGEELTLEEVGNLIGLTRERVRQIQVRAIDRLKYMAGLNRTF